jgi:hypothetical protein
MDTGSGTNAIALLSPCLMYVNLRVTGIGGNAIQNQAIIVSEAFSSTSFTVDSPFSPVGQMHVRGDGSAGYLSFFT